MIRPSPALLRDSFFRSGWLLVFLCLAEGLAGQGVRGRIYDDVTRNPVADALLHLYSGDTVLAVSTTDASGIYWMPFARSGRIDILVEAAGYSSLLIPEVLLDGFSTVVIDHGITPRTISLDEVAVTAYRLPATPYIASIRADDLVRIAGHYDDPVRAAQSLPGIVLTNDQGNHFSFRGQSPVMNTWMVEGLEVANPNHLNNAGTFSDKPALSGGGVNLFSAQVLDVTSLYTGPAPMQVGRNAGAVIDQHLRESPEAEWRLKAGLIGFEAGGTAFISPALAVDGQLRYSFTGLLTSLGADFGGDRIGFYDGVYSLRWTMPNGKLKVFGWAGRSDTDFDRVEDSRARTRYKDFFTTRYDNRILGQGMTYQHSFHQDLSFQAGASYSVLDATYLREGEFGQTTFDEEIASNQRVFAGFGKLACRWSPTLAWEAGVAYILRDLGDDPGSFTPFLSESSLRPYGELTLRLNTALQLDGGIDVTYTLPDREVVPGISARLQWEANNNIQGWLGLRQGAGQRVRTYEAAGDARLLSVLNTQAGLRLLAGRHVVTQNVYFQRTSGMAVGIIAEGFVHMADYGDGPWTSLPYLGARGYMRQWGWEGSWRYTDNRHFTIEFNQSLLQGLRALSDEQPSKGRYANGFASHIMISKEFFGRRKNKERVWHVSLRALFHGGLREPAIDQTASAAALGTVYADPYTYTQRLPAYRRLDLTLTRTLASPRRRVRIVLDVQNVLSLENTAFRYYDPFLHRIQEQAQLGLIPVLSVQISGTAKR